MQSVHWLLITQVFISPEDFRALMMVIDSLDDGKEGVEAEEEGAKAEAGDSDGKVTTSPGGREGTGTNDGNYGESLESEEEEEEEEIVHSEVHVMVKIGQVHVVLHSYRTGNIMALSLKGDAIILATQIQFFPIHSDVQYSMK